MRAGPLQVTRGGLIGTVVVLLVAAVCFRLGLWQMDRRAERAALNDAIETRMALPPLELTRLPEDTSGLTYRRAVLHGECDAAHPLVVAGRSRRGAPGAELWCAFLPAAGGPAIALQRGWAPAADARSVDRALLAPTDVRDSVAAMLMPLIEGDPDGGAAARRATAAVDEGPAVVYRMNRTAIQAALPQRISPLYARRLDGDVARGMAPPETPDLSAGPHLSYAVQWFSFGLIGLIGWIALAVGRGEIGRAGVRAERPEARRGERPGSPPGDERSPR